MIPEVAKWKHVIEMINEITGQEGEERRKKVNGLPQMRLRAKSPRTISFLQLNG